MSVLSSSIKQLAVAGAFLCASLSAATVGPGTFNLSGTAVGTLTGIDFYFATPGDQTGTINLPTTGVFASLAPGTKEVIQNLSAPTVIPGTSFDFMNWIQLTDGINLDLTSLPIPSFPLCPASGSEAIGFECIANIHSPVVLTQTATGVSASVSLSGSAHYVGDETDLTPFTGLLTAPSTPFSTIADFETYYDTNGGIPAVSFSGSFTTVPEPGALALTGLGLIGVSLRRRRKLQKNAAL